MRFFKKGTEGATDGMQQIAINYPPDFKPRYGYGSPQARFIEAIFKSRLGEQRDFLSAMAACEENFSAIPVDAPEESESPRWNQAWFPPLDGMSMYAMVASRKPGRYIEIGSGNSTKFAVRAIRDHGLSTEVISVDPRPRAEVDSICNRVIREPLEEATGLDDLLSMLTPADIVFFDGSHRCLQNSDVTSFFIDYIPVIPAGVTVGIHDIFWPSDYPEKWVTRYYSEQYILAAYMLALGSSFPLIFSCAYMGKGYGGEVRRCLSADLLAKLNGRGLGIGGGTLWFSKPDVPFL